MSTKVTVIIITYNAEQTIRNCLISLNNQTFQGFEVILIDNKSQDDTVKIIDSSNPLLRYPFKSIYLDTNRGFADSNNYALRYTTNKYIALLNPDAFAEKLWLEELVTAMGNDPGVGICASKLIVNNSNIIDSAGDGYAKSLKGFKHGEGEPATKHSNKEYLFGACAGAALYRKSMIDKIGFMDEDFFIIHEDTDLNFRTQLAGWKTLYVPTAIVYHEVRTSIGHMSDTAVYYSLRNSDLVRIKNVPLAVFLWCFPEFTIGWVWEFIYFVIKHKKLKIFFKAKIDALWLLPAMLKKRKTVMKHKSVSNRYIRNIMTPLWQGDFFKSKLKKFANG